MFDGQVLLHALALGVERAGHDPQARSARQERLEHLVALLDELLPELSRGDRLHTAPDHHPQADASRAPSTDAPCRRWIWGSQR